MLESATASLVASGAEEASVKVQLALARRHFAGRRAAEAKKQVQATLEALERATASGQSAYRNYGRSSYQTRRENLQVVAAEYARGGQWDEVKEALGQSADAPPSTRRGVTPIPPYALVAWARHLASLPPVEHFETLRAWTMPNEGRSTIRSLNAFAPTDLPPEGFGRFAAIGDGSALISTLEMLVKAAKDAGKLDDLASEARLAVEQKREDAEPLANLVAIAQGRPAEAEPALNALLAEWSKKVEEPSTLLFGPQPIKPTPWADYLRVRAALADPKLAPLGAKLAEKSKSKLADSNIQGHLRQDLVRSLVMASDSRDPGLASWEPVGRETAASSRRGLAPGRWIVQGGHIHRRGGSGGDPYAETPNRPETLVFSIPLTGRFTFRVDASGPGAEVGYGGRMLSPSAADDGSSGVYTRTTNRTRLVARVRPIGASETIARPSMTSPNSETVRLAIEVEPGSVRYLVDGRIVFHDRDSSPASPWLVLGASGDGDVDFRNLRLEGSPTIPREVALTFGDRLEGWLSDHFDETRSKRPIGPDGRPKSNPLGTASAPNPDSDWSALDGEIRARRLPDPGSDGPMQGRLAYHRPLKAGESIAYEFFHEPDAVTVHPALGRLAFLVEASGVRLHWMTDGPDLDISGLPAANVIDEPSSRRGPSPLPLKSREWNQLKLALVGRTVEIELNGVKVFERDLEPANDRVFSFYHDKARVGSRIREVVLKGDWPDSVASADLARRRDEGTPEARRGRSAAIGEVAFARDARAILDASKTLTPDRRYEMLRAWVLPADDHASLRLAGDFAPTDSIMTPSPVEFPPGSTRVHVGGTFDAPALALVAAAREAEKLGELLDTIERIQPANDLDRRGKLALKTLAPNDQDAAIALGGLKPLLEAVSPEAPESERWPELVALAGALGRPALKGPAKALAEAIVVGQIRKEHMGIGETWKLQALRLAGLLDRGEPVVPTFAADPGLAAWSRVTHASPRSRGTGAPLPSWSIEGGTLTHRPGLDRDFVYAKTPLRGDFEVSGIAPGGRALHLAYGGFAVGVAVDGKEVVVSPLGQPSRKVALEPPLPAGDGPRQVRLKVQGGILSAFVGDRKIFDQGLPAKPDPWLAIGLPADESGSLRELKLEGNPAVPDRLDLSDQPNLMGWLAGEDITPADGVDPPWRKRGDEIVGRPLKDAAGSKQESLLQYHRPLVEDGEVSYEFYHEPGRAAVAPALDHLAFLVEPGGFQLHRITDAPFDRTGLDPGNASTEPSIRRALAEIPLKPGAWNTMTLAVSGDKVTLKLNDAIILERPIEPTNQRTFGLFHFADEGEARVRNVTYRGNWPRVLNLGFDR